MENQSKTKSDDFVAEDSNQTNVAQFDELVLIIDECHIAASVCDQPSDKVPTSIQEEVQSIPIETPILPQLPHSEMVMYGVPKESIMRFFRFQLIIKKQR